jgi:hypothetical protein
MPRILFLRVKSIDFRLRDAYYITMFRFQGQWFTVKPKQFEPERQTHEIMWKVAGGTDSKKAYREWYEKERKISSLIYPVIYNGK